MYSLVNLGCPTISITFSLATSIPTEIIFVAKSTFEAYLLFFLFSSEYSTLSNLSRVSLSSVVDTRLVNSSAPTIKRLPVNIRFPVLIIKSLTSSSTRVEALPKSFRLLKYTVNVQSLSFTSSGKWYVSSFCSSAAIIRISIIALVLPDGITPTYFLPY